MPYIKNVPAITANCVIAVKKRSVFMALGGAGIFTITYQWAKEQVRKKTWEGITCVLSEGKYHEWDAKFFRQ
jgi:hypothetical protein